MAKKKITEIVEEMLGDFLATEGYELYNTEFVKEGRDCFLRVYIDKPSCCEYVYIGTEDCEKVSRFLSGKLDEADPIEQNYYLEVSSPGIDRPLRTPEHFNRFAGQTAVVKASKGINGRSQFTAVIVGADGEKLTLDDQGTSIEIPFDLIKRAHLKGVIDFSENKK